MTRASLLLVAALVLATGPASAAERGAVLLGADLQLQFHEGPGGDRAVLPALGVRATTALHPNLGLTLAGGFATGGPAGGLASALTLLGRAALRADVFLPVNSSAFVFGVGPGVQLTSTTLSDGGRPVAAATIVRPGVAGLVGFESRVGNLAIRAGFELLWTLPRLDLFAGLGAEWSFGGSR
jgi:hypothetical protein